MVKLLQRLADGVIFRALYLEDSSDPKFTSTEPLAVDDDPWEKHVDELHDLLDGIEWEGDSEGIAIFEPDSEPEDDAINGGAGQWVLRGQTLTDKVMIMDDDMIKNPLIFQEIVQ